MSATNEFTMLDPSILASYEHMKTLVDSSLPFSIPAKLHELLVEKRDDRLSDLVSHFNQGLMPRKKAREFWPLIYERAKPYSLRKKFADEIAEGAAKSVSEDVEMTLKESYSFLREHSWLVAKNTNFTTHFRRAGVPVLDATTKRGVRKPRFFERLSGVRWVLGIGINAATMFELDKNPRLAEYFLGLNFVLAVIDP